MFPISTIHVLCYEWRLKVLQDNVSYINNTRIMLWRETYGFTGQCFLYQQYTYYVMRTTYGFREQCFLYQQYTYYVMRDDLWFYRTMFPISTIHVLCYELWDDLWFYRTMFPISTIHVSCYEGRLIVLQDNVSYINNSRIMLWGTTYGFKEQCFLYQQYTYYVIRDDYGFINNTRIMLWGTTYGFTGQCFLYQQYTYYVMSDDLGF